MANDRRIRRALISVHDKTGVVEFARALHAEFGIEIISTGGTANTLREAGIRVTLIETITGFPELLDGRVKTLHPKIHAAILADRDNPEHMRQLKEHGIEPIDMVVVNLYPFEETVADRSCTFEQAIEMIDIGGVALLRAAGKNHRHVTAVVNHETYDTVLYYLRHELSGDMGMGSCYALFSRSQAFGAVAAFLETARYDGSILEWLSSLETDDHTPCVRFLEFIHHGVLRYGENPHVRGELLQTNLAGDELDLTSADARFEDYPPKLSYNNYLDADAALGLCAELTRASDFLVFAAKAAEECGTGFQPVKVQGADECGTGFQPVKVRAGFQPASKEKRWNRRVTAPELTKRNLPHLQIPGSTYFLTFRVLSGQLAPNERDVVMQACKYWHGTKATVHAAVVMPDHVHLLLTPHQIRPGEWISLAEILQSIKRFSAMEINKLRGTQGALWLDEAFDRVVRDEREFVEKWEYMQVNPVTAGICGPGEYKWFWRSETQFQEVIHTDRLETGHTSHRLQTGATVCVFVKHTNACGVGVAGDPLAAYRLAYLGDPNAAMGGVLAVNFAVSAEFAAHVMETYDRLGKAAGAGGFFVEVWIAPSFEEEAVKIIRGTAEPSEALPSPPKKKWGENARLLEVDDMSAPPDPDALQYRSIAGGMIAQTPDVLGLNEEQWKVVTKRAPTDAEMADLRLAWLICKHTKSNAISICKDGILIGNGAGQMSRVTSCRIATWLARENGHEARLKGSVAASDAFFPFRDGPDILIDAGVTAIIQPGGSKRDEDTIKVCDERGVAMIFTGTRHFRH